MALRRSNDVVATRVARSLFPADVRSVILRLRAEFIEPESFQDILQLWMRFHSSSLRLVELVAQRRRGERAARGRSPAALTRIRRLCCVT